MTSHAPDHRGAIRASSELRLIIITNHKEVVLRRREKPDEPQLRGVDVLELAWLVATLASRRRAVTAAAAVLALGGLVAAVANLIEDGLGLKAFGEALVAGCAFACDPRGPLQAPRSVADF